MAGGRTLAPANMTTIGITTQQPSPLNSDGKVFKLPNIVLVVGPEPGPGEQYFGGLPRKPGEPLKPLVVGDGSGGDVNMLCGECGFQIVEGLHAGQLQSRVLECPRCLKWNRTRT